MTPEERRQLYIAVYVERFGREPRRLPEFLEDE